LLPNHLLLGFHVIGYHNCDILHEVLISNSPWLTKRC
jgi:hypothetical protein